MCDPLESLPSKSHAIVSLSLSLIYICRTIRVRTLFIHNMTERSLESTPSWAVASVCTVLVLIALLLEYSLHLLTQFVRRRKRKPLIHAVCHIKAELRNFGFMSLLLTIAGQPISKICIPTSFGDSFLPCKHASSPISSVDGEVDYCVAKGMVPLVSSGATEQLMVLILSLAVYHLLSCLLTMALAEAKMNQWERWEKAAKSIEYKLSHDPRRLKLTRQTSFGKRHLKFWSDRPLILCLVGFIRQFVDPISKADYFALRHGFLKAHLVDDSNFDFHKLLRRSLDQDLAMVVRISPWIWMYALLFIFFNAHEFYNHYWLPFIPLVMLLAIGTKLETIISKMCLKSSQGAIVVPGMIYIKPDNDYFWFRRPKLLLHILQFILIQNAFQMAFFTWSWYKFGLQSCFYEEIEDTVLSIVFSIPVHLLCAYVTLPLYALVAQMGSSMKETVFTERIIQGLRNWSNTAKKSRSTKPSTSSTPSPMQPLQRPRRRESLLLDEPISKGPRFQYPSGRLELLEVQRVVGEIIEHNVNDTPNDREISFRMWWKQEVTSSRGPRI